MLFYPSFLYILCVASDAHVTSDIRTDISLTMSNFYISQSAYITVMLSAMNEMQIMSNGIFKSPMHRAVTNLEKERISVAMFWAPELGKEIGPLEGLINEERPRRFAKLKDYHLTYFKHYQLNQRAIDAVRIN